MVPLELFSRVGFRHRLPVVAGVSKKAGTMRAILRIIGAIALVASGVSAKNWIVSPAGLTTGAATKESPLDVYTAVQSAAPGDSILLQDGTYDLATTIKIDSLNSGNATQRKYLGAAKGARPVFDFSKQAYASSNRGIELKGNYWTIFGIEIKNAGDNGIKLEGNHNRIERCVFHHNGDSGIQLGFAHETANPDGTRCSYNEIIDCDSYANFDWGTLGGNADGFACKMHNGKGNVFRGCRAWHNSDDGWDLYETDWPVEITECWSWHNGDQTDFDSIYLVKAGKKMSSFSGNGNGIKLGGNGTGGSSKGQHVVTRCVAFNNRFKSLKGFDQNSHKGGVIVKNSTAWNNGYNFMFEDDASGSTNEFSNNVSFSPKNGTGWEFSSGAILKNNSWNLTGVTASAADFVDTTEAAAGAPRQADGSLPQNGFARLTKGSGLIDKGTPVGLTFAGAAPDLGAFEYGAISDVAKRPRVRTLTRNGRDLMMPSDRTGVISLEILDLTGRKVRNRSAEILSGTARFPGALEGLSEGMWIVRIQGDGEGWVERIAAP